MRKRTHSTTTTIEEPRAEDVGDAVIRVDRTGKPALLVMSYGVVVDGAKVHRIKEVVVSSLSKKAAQAAEDLLAEALRIAVHDEGPFA